jgi:Concanavalin A-like lectin/glucanases superfamily/Secretion system C-terminal sorting domain/Purple acid Phosphatase, N-terminal domain
MTFAQNFKLLLMKKLLLFIVLITASNNSDAQTLLQYFKFNNSVTNEAGTASFTGGNIGLFGIGMDVTNIGKRIQNGDNLSCNLSNLPQGNQPRTISFWSRFAASGNHYMFSYGTQITTQAYGLTQGTTLVNFSWANDLTVNLNYNTNTWYHYVCTYDGAQMKVYRNNVLQGTYSISLNTTGTTFYLGSVLGSFSQNTINANIDELQIYSGAITPEQVNYLYTVGGPLPTQPSISGISVSANGSASATLNYSLNANGNATTSVVKYGTSAASLTNQVSGFSASSTSITPGSATLTGLVSGTTYYYQIEATNTNGTATSTVGSFINTQMEGIAEYNFNNTYNNVIGNTPFSSNVGTSFVTGRDGVTPNGALNLNNTGTMATIPNLPYGSSPRTVSVWIKMNTVQAGFNFIYNYGNSSGYYGAYFSSSNLYHFANNGSHSYATTTPINQWIHYAFSYDGTQSKIYKNGVLVGTDTKSWNTINNSNLFRLGLTEDGSSNFFNGGIDDLKIFGSALTDAEIANLYTNNSILASQNFNSQNLKATIYPNPASDHFTIEMENELQSVEIYSLQGQKVLTATDKNVSVSNLSKGMYLVRIEDENNAISTQKLIVK